MSSLLICDSPARKRGRERSRRASGHERCTLTLLILRDFYAPMPRRHQSLPGNWRALC